MFCLKKTVCLFYRERVTLKDLDVYPGWTNPERDRSPGGMGGYPPRKSCDPLGARGLVERFLLSSPIE